MRNVVWRTPGSDGGRDIEATEFIRDVSGYDATRKWYIECKRYAKSIDWPTVWNKLSYADVQNADYLLLATNNNPSPTCESKISEWNLSSKRPIIRVWRGYDLPKLLVSHPDIAVTHGLSNDPAIAQASLVPLMSISTKLGNAAYSARVFEMENIALLETVSALNELISRRMSDLREFGKPAFSASAHIDVGFDWLQVSGEIEAWESVAIRAFMAMFRHLTRADEVAVQFNSEDAAITLIGSQFELKGRAASDIDTVARWAGLQFTNENGNLTVNKCWDA